MSPHVRARLEAALDGFRSAATELEEVARHALDTHDYNVVERALMRSVLSTVELKGIINRAFELTANG